MIRRLRVKLPQYAGRLVRFQRGGQQLQQRLVRQVKIPSVLTNAELLQNDELEECARTRFAQNILTMSQQMRGLPGNGPRPSGRNV